MVRILPDNDQVPARPKFNFQRVGAKSKLLGTPTGGPAKATVLPTGRTGLTVGATDMFEAAAVEKGLDPKTCAVSLGVDEQAKVVGVSPVPSGTRGSKDPRRNLNRRTMTLHLGSVFKDSPLLRQTGVHECNVTEGLDENDQPCIVIALGSSLIKVPGAAGKKAGTEAKAPGSADAGAQSPKTEPEATGPKESVG